MPDKRHISIIHLEDNPLDAELTQEMLLDCGFEFDLQRIYRLEDFRNCMEQYMEKPNFDLILADYNMPGFDGLTALKMTRQVDSDIPFVLLSGALGEELAVELLRTGATDYVLKNNMQRLPLVLNRAIEEANVRRSEKASQDEARKARDEAQNANNAKSRFLSRISHELRTPLNAIIGYTQLLQADPLNEEQEHSADQILKAGEHLLKLINEVLDITRIESGVINMEIKPVPLEPIIEKSIDLIRPMAREAQVSVSTDEGPCHLYILADKDRLTQVLINLLGNAIKYNRPSGYVFVECHKERPGFVKLMVRDTGIGIPPRKMERLFTPFDRLDLEKDSAIPGTGLGLTVSKSLVEQMGGTIGVVSSENEGTVFWVEIPATSTVTEGETTKTDSESDPFLVPVSGCCKVLLIEDDIPAGDFMKRVFRRREIFNFRIAETLEAAHKALAEEIPDVVLIDLNLPDGDGEDVIQHILSNPEYSHVPIAIITADACSARKQRLIDMGTRGYFTKPVKINTLFSEIYRLHAESKGKHGV